MTLPLEGFKVLDISRVLAGPYCCSLLGEVGAEVIKVERPGLGDENRRWGALWNGESLDYLSVNRNKRSLTVNIKCAEGQEIIRRIAAQSDVLVENFSGPVLDDLGLGYEQLSAINPGLVYCSISAYGAKGPMKDKPAYDGAVQAFSGHMSITGEPGGGPVRTGASVVDLGTGITAYGAVMTALLQRTRTGKGQKVTVSLLQTAIALMAQHAASFLMHGEEPRRAGAGVSHLAPYGAYRTKDAWVVTGALNDASWKTLCGVLDCEELTRDPRFVDGESRVRNRSELDNALGVAFAKQTSAEWTPLFEKAGVVIAPVNTLKDSLNHPQVLANNLVVAVQHVTAGEVRLAGAPMGFSSWNIGPRLPPPALAQHTEEILAEYGYGAAEIAALREQSIV